MAAYCPVPSKTTKTNYSGTPGKKTVYAPPPRNEACNPSSSSTIIGGGSQPGSSNTVYVPGPAGPAGPKGDAGWGYKWEGEWELNKDYKAQSEENPLASTVSYNGSSYVAVSDNKSITEENPEFQPDRSIAWQLIAQQGASGTTPAEKSLLEKAEDLWDFLKNASLEEILKAALPYIGIVVAGAAVAAMLTDDGEGDGEADTRYTGSPGFVSTGFVLPTIRQAITSLCNIEGINFNVDALVDEPCTFVIGEVTSIRSILDQLSLAYQFKMVDSGGVLRFVTRTNVAVKSIPISDMGFGSDNIDGTPPAPYKSQRFQGIDLPKRVTLEYYSAANDYNTFTQSTDIYTYEEGQVVQLSVPVTLTDAKAKYITEITAINAHLERMNYSFTTSYKHMDLEAGDIVDTYMGLVSITRLSEGDEGILTFEAVDAGAIEAVNGSNLEAISPPPSTNIPIVIGYSQGFPIDPPNIDDTDKDVRIYFAVHGYDRPGWPGADIYVSENNGASYDLIDTARKEATLGMVTNITASADYHVWDDVTEIVVQLKTNSLISVQDIDVYNGKNWAMVGREMIGFGNATLVGENTYKLTHLLRGRQGTEQFVGTHEAQELFVLLDDSLVRVEWSAADRNKIKKYKIVTIGSSLDKVDGFDVQMASNNTRMWTVSDAKVLKGGSDFQFSWKERVRYNNEIVDSTTTNHDPDWAGYGIQIYAADGTTVKRNITTTQTNYIYTAAMQTEDFGAPQANIKAAIVQMSKDYGAGYPVNVQTT